MHRGALGVIGVTTGILATAPTATSTSSGRAATLIVIGIRWRVGLRPGVGSSVRRVSITGTSAAATTAAAAA